MMTQRQ